MNVEQELTQWLDANLPDSRANKQRDTKAVLLHYGFGDHDWPTLEQIGQELSIGTRERVRQVLNASFKGEASIEQLPVLSEALEEINKVDFAPISEVRQKLVGDGVISASTCIRGLLNLGRDLNALDSYELVNDSLHKITRAEAEFDEKTFVGTKSAIQELKDSYKKAKKLPGLLGLASYQYLRDAIGVQAAERIIRFIEISADAEHLSHDGEEWYIFEDRDNTLINSCEKICAVCGEHDVEILAGTLRNALRRRSQKYAYPNADVIAKWIYQSKWFAVENGIATFLGNPETLTEIESAVVEYLSERESRKYPEIRDHLLRLGFTKPSADKAITTSPLVYVDKAGTRKTYTYTLISKVPVSGGGHADPDVRYRKYRNRLKRLLTSGGVDVSENVVLRREQSILREWLFEGKKRDKCAICGNEYSVGALVTAHKKRRADCIESEKTDPWVVFPLCAFGCDFLYETGMVKIVKGKVVNASKDGLQTKDALSARDVHGNVIDEKWMKGKKSYFNET